MLVLLPHGPSPEPPRPRRAAHPAQPCARAALRPWVCARGSGAQRGRVPQALPVNIRTLVHTRGCTERRAAEPTKGSR